METVSYVFNDDILVISLNGRVDTTNAPEVEKLILEACDKNPTDNVLVDADDLQYISSAGLRVILRLKKLKPELKIINVSTDVYEIFEMTGFSEIINIEKAFRKLSVDGCEIIGKGAKGTVYRYSPDTIVKLYHNPDSLPDIKRERELAREAFVLGIPTAIPYDTVRIGESYGSVFELLDAKSYSALISSDPDNFKKYVKDFADLSKLIHSTMVKADDMPDAKLMAAKWIDCAKKYLSPDDSKKLCDLVDALPDTLNMLHCDYHTNNIMMQNDETLLIDMDTLSHGHPIFELANVFVTYVGFLEFDPKDVESFLSMPAETSVAVWNQFLPDYLGTTDKQRIAEVEDKVKLLGYCRVLRHTLRHQKNEEIKNTVLETCPKLIHELLAKVDTLEF